MSLSFLRRGPVLMAVERATSLYSQVLFGLSGAAGLDAAPDQVLFEVLADFAYPVAGRRQAATTDRGGEDLFGESPLSAARKWLWRLPCDEHEAVDRLTVRSPPPHPRREVYDGPTIVFERVGHALTEVERRAL